MGKELELKYLLNSPEQGDELLNHPLILSQLDGPVVVYNMDSIYYDTADHQLSKKRISLRRRKENDEIVFTVKVPFKVDGAFASRGEWQVTAETLPEALEMLKNEGAPDLLFELLRESTVVPCARTIFVRKTAPLKLGAHLCVDVGILGKTPFAEIELELSTGSIDELTYFGNECARTFNLIPESRSKLARAIASFN